MELTNKHIEQLYKFTRQHYVEHYDVQTELVDHLANDIEQVFRENPTLTFEQARDKSFKKFGVFGFMNVVEEKQKQLGRKYRSILWTYAKEWFRIPKIVFTVSIFLFFYYCLQLRLGGYLVGITLFILASLDVYFAFKLKREFKKRTKEDGKKWMLEEMIFNVASFGGVMVASNVPQIYNHIEKIPSTIGAITISVIVTLTIIYSYITLIVIPSKAEELLKNNYPEYKLMEG